MARETSDFNKAKESAGGAADLNLTPSANRIHIGFFGRRNAGKSSVVNAVTGQSISIVSDVKGTTTDPVTKAMELLPLGPVLIIDTPGIDDSGSVGAERVKRANRILTRTDVAVLVVDNFIGLSDDDRMLIDRFRERNIPFIVALNKVDLAMESLSAGGSGAGASGADDLRYKNPDIPFVLVSALTGQGINDLKEKIAEIAKPRSEERKLIRDLIPSGSVVVLVTPIDDSAPKGRIILPQVQTIRDLLDGHAITVVCQPDELPGALAALREKPAAVITDSQVFGKVSRMVPEDIPLTSFSILFARFKGILDTAAEGAFALSEIKDGDRILISEGCTHHRQCEDIGTVKLPGWIRGFTDAEPEFSFTSGGEFPEDLSGYSLVVHCGGCMLNEREVMYRMERALIAGVPFTNYGTLIAHMNGILRRCLEIFDI